MQRKYLGTDFLTITSGGLPTTSVVESSNGDSDTVGTVGTVSPSRLLGANVDTDTSVTRCSDYLQETGLDYQQMTVS